MEILDKLHELASEANSTDSSDKLSSIIGMVSSLIKDGKISSLDDTLRQNFPDYYFGG